MSDIGAFALNLIAAYSHIDMLTLTHREILSGFTMCHLFFGKILPASGESQFFPSVTKQFTYFSFKLFGCVSVECGSEILSIRFVTIQLAKLLFTLLLFTISLNSESQMVLYSNVTPQKQKIKEYKLINEYILQRKG